MPTGYIGDYVYYTPDDLDYIINNAQNCNTNEEIWYKIKTDILDIIYLTQRYATALYNYEYYYLDDGR